MITIVDPRVSEPRRHLEDDTSVSCCGVDAYGDDWEETEDGNLCRPPALLRVREAMNGMREIPDAELMAQVQNGERAAFAQLINRHKDALVNYLSRLTGCRERAEEHAQEAFLRLYQASARYREQGRLVPYLYRIATNLVRSEERKARRWRFLSSAFSTNGHRSSSSPQALLLEAEIKERVTNALRTLPTHYRAPLVLREIEGWSYQDIARAVGCREGTVKSRINRGRSRLREILEPYVKGGKQ